MAFPLPLRTREVLLQTHASNKHEWQNHVLVLQGTWPCQGVDIPGRCWGLGQWWNWAEPALMVETHTCSGSEVVASLLGQSWVMGGPLHLSSKKPASLPVSCTLLCRLDLDFRPCIGTLGEGQGPSSFLALNREQAEHSY